MITTNHIPSPLIGQNDLHAMIAKLFGVRTRHRPFDQKGVEIVQSHALNTLRSAIHTIQPQGRYYNKNNKREQKVICIESNNTYLLAIFVPR